MAFRRTPRSACAGGAAGRDARWRRGNALLPPGETGYCARMHLSDFDFELPEALIALRPASPRDSARLLVVRPGEGLEDRRVGDLPDLLRGGDALVFNDTRVIAARLSGVRYREDSTVAVEATLHRRLTPSRWTAFMRPGKRLRVGDRVRFGERTDRACLLGALDAT